MANQGLVETTRTTNEGAEEVVVVVEVVAEVEMVGKSSATSRRCST